MLVGLCFDKGLGLCLGCYASVEHLLKKMEKRERNVNNVSWRSRFDLC